MTKVISGPVIQSPFEVIKQRRSQMLIHSYLYYRLAESLVTDAQFDSWARELVALHGEWGTEIGFYDEAFADWTGDTGYHLPRDDWIEQKAWRLLRTRQILE